MSDLNYFNSESNSYSSGYFSMKYVVRVQGMMSMC